MGKEYIEKVELEEITFGGKLAIRFYGKGRKYIGSLYPHGDHIDVSSDLRNSIKIETLPDLPQNIRNLIYCQNNEKQNEFNKEVLDRISGIDEILKAVVGVLKNQSEFDKIHTEFLKAVVGVLKNQDKIHTELSKKLKEQMDYHSNKIAGLEKQ